MVDKLIDMLIEELLEALTEPQRLKVAEALMKTVVTQEYLQEIENDG